jgi:hypothetical protein
MRERADAGDVNRTQEDVMSAAVTGITNERMIGPIAAAIAIGALAVANFVADGDNGGAGPFAVTAVITLVVAALLFGRVVPAARESSRSGRTALALAVLAALTLVAFWSGLPQVLAPAAIVIGLAAPRSGESVAAVVLGSIAYVASLVAVFIG